MTKKAVLVEFSILTRVIVDVPEGQSVDSDEMFETTGGKALDNIRRYVSEDIHYPYLENIVEINEDTEVPFGTLDEDE